MKYLALVIFLTSTLMFSCSSEDDSLPNENLGGEIVDDMSEGGDNGGGDIPDVDDNEGGDNGEGGDNDENEDLITYVDDVAPLLSANCLECHGETRINGATISLHTYELVKDKYDPIMYRVNNEVNPMPPASRGGLMSEEDRAIITEWIEDGLLEN